MIFIQHALRVFGSVLSMGFYKDKLLVLDNGYNLYTFDRSTFDFLNRVQITSKYEPRHRFEKSMVVSNHLDIFVSIPRSTGCFLLNHEDKLKIVSQINNHTTPPTAARFSPDGSILAVGDEGGKIFLYKMPKGKFLTALKRRPDYIAALAFSNNNRYIAISSFDRATMIYDFETCKYIENFISDGVIEKMVFSANNENLVCITRSSKVLKYDLKEKKLQHGDGEFSAWPTAIANIGERHVVVGSKDNNLNIVDLASLKIQQTVDLNNHGISSFIVIGSHLFVGFTDGEIKIIDTQKNAREFSIALSLNKFKEATELVHQNAFLITQEVFSTYDRAWPETLQNAKDLITKGQKIAAIDLARPFFIDKAKEEEFQFCLGNIKHLLAFQRLIERKEYIRAMMLADEMEFLKKTSEYKVIENVWYKIFQTAKELIEENNVTSLNKAKEILSKYVIIKSKATQINNLLTNTQAYIQASKYIKEKNFSAYFVLTRDNPCLETEEIYKRVLTIGYQTYDKMKKYEYEEDMDEAIKIGEYLRMFLPLREMIDKALEILKAKKDLLNKINMRDFSGIYSAVSKMPELEVFGSFHTFHTEFVKLKKRAMEFALDAKPKEVIYIFQIYFNIPYVAPIITNTMKVAYLSEIEKTLESDLKSKIDWKETYIRFMGQFGVSEELLALYKAHDIEEYITDSRIGEMDEDDSNKPMAFYDTLLNFIP